MSKQLLSPYVYLNYDAARDRAVLQKEEWDKSAALVIFDELHKRKNWKSWIKGIYDTRGDLLDLENVRDIKSIEILIDLLKPRVGSRTSFASLAEDLQVSAHTVKHWLQILESLCLVFSVRPYHRSVTRSLRKDLKYYFYDIGAVEGNLGSRLENAVAAALLRELHYVEDTKGSRVALHYLRDKEKNEVDFLAVIDNKPVLMVEVKAGDDSFAKSLFRFKKAVGDVRTVQAVYGLDRKKSRDGVDMVAAHEFLAELRF